MLVYVNCHNLHYQMIICITTIHSGLLFQQIIQTTQSILQSNFFVFFISSGLLFRQCTLGLRLVHYKLCKNYQSNLKTVSDQLYFQIYHFG